MDRKIETWKQKGRKAQVGKLGKKIRSGLARNFQNAKTSSSLHDLPRVFFRALNFVSSQLSVLK